MIYQDDRPVNRIIDRPIDKLSERSGTVRKKNKDQNKKKSKRDYRAYIKYIGTAVIFILTFYLLFSYKGLNLFLWS